MGSSGWRQRARLSSCTGFTGNGGAVYSTRVERGLPATLLHTPRIRHRFRCICAAGMSRSLVPQPRRSMPRAWRWRRARHRCICSRVAPRLHRCQSPARAAIPGAYDNYFALPDAIAGSRRFGFAAGDRRRRPMRSSGPSRSRTSICILRRHGVGRNEDAVVVVRAAGEDVPLRLCHCGNRLLRGLGSACGIGGLPRGGSAVARSLRAVTRRRRSTSLARTRISARGTNTSGKHRVLRRICATSMCRTRPASSASACRSATYPA